MVSLREAANSGCGLYVKNGEVRLTGNGKFNVRTEAFSGYGAYAINSIVEVTNATGGEGYYTSGIDNTRGEVTVYGNVTSGMAGVRCFGHDTKATVTIYGDLTCSYPSAVGIEVGTINGPNDISLVTVDGKVTASKFAKIYDVTKNPTDFVFPTTKPGYITYSLNSRGGYATLWVKNPEALSYTVSFEANGGTPAPKTQTVPEGAAAYQPADMIKEGYTFMGWYVNTEFTGEPYDFNSPMASDMTLYANWMLTPTKYIVSFVANGGSPAPAPQTVAKGSAAVQPIGMARSGYDFGGWYTNADCTGTPYLFGTVVNSDIVLYAKWTVTPVKYTVSFVANGGAPAPAAQTVAQGSAALQPAGMTRSGYDFGGWYTNASFTGTPYLFGTAVNANFTLYAKWTVTPKYMVSFVANGGSPAPVAQTVDKGGCAVAPSGMSKVGYVFDGWYTSDKLNGKAYVFSTSVSGNLTLYAKWNAAPPRYTVSFVANGGSPAPVSQMVDKGGTAVAPQVMLREGYAFDGWFTSDKLNGKAFSFSTGISSDLVLYAKWVKK